MSNELESTQDKDPIDVEAARFEEGDVAEDPDSSEVLDDELLDDWGGGELEAAYLKALSALEASETEMTPVAADSSDHAREDVPEEMDETDDHSKLLESETQGSLPRPVLDAPATEVRNSPSSASALELASTAELPPAPRQIIEACLFVGGTALTSKRLSGVLRGEFDSDFIDREINALNRLYAAENRPYEIQMVEGGYRLTLREEFERIRHKVYGLGPKEVRLSQEALEVLAVVAYHQPIKQSRVEELGKPGCGPVLRQLVRRELIAVERDPVHPRDVNYTTTARFLSLFDLRSLDELPRHEQVAYK